MRYLVAAVAALLSSCSVNKAVISKVTPDRAVECRKACGDLGMQLSAMVLIMDSAGCVCMPQGDKVTDAAPGAAAASGGAAIAAAAQAAAAAHASTMHQQRSHHATMPR